MWKDQQNILHSILFIVNTQLGWAFELYVRFMEKLLLYKNLILFENMKW